MFYSTIAADLEEFLRFKQSRGYRYDRGEFILRSFDRFVAARVREEGRSFRLEHAPLRWLASRPNRKACSTVGDMSVVRQFWEYMQSRHSRRRWPDVAWPRLPVKSTFAPHVFTRGQIQALLRQIDANGSVYDRALLRTTFLVLYCTGLRFGEVTRLRVQDVDLRRHVLFITESKGRARWVPFHPSLARELAAYLKVRRAEDRGRHLRPGNPFFVRSRGRRLPVQRLSDALRELMRQSGLKPAHGRVGPRPYDLRHTFAVHRLTRWYREGADLHSRLAWLSAFMGHVDLSGTETYLKATPELLALAADRFRRRYQVAGRAA